MVMLLHFPSVGNSLQGSGKTLAFGLPIMQLLMAERQAGVARHGPKDLKALVLAPTRELALQVGLTAAKHRLLATVCCSHVGACCSSCTSCLIHPCGLLQRTTASSQETSAWQGPPRACRCVTTCRKLGSPAASGWSQSWVASAWPNRSACSGSSPRWADQPAVQYQCVWQACPMPPLPGQLRLLNCCSKLRWSGGAACLSGHAIGTAGLLHVVLVPAGDCCHPWALMGADARRPRPPDCPGRPALPGAGRG